MASGEDISCAQCKKTREIYGPQSRPSCSECGRVKIEDVRAAAVTAFILKYQKFFCKQSVHTAKQADGRTLRVYSWDIDYGALKDLFHAEGYKGFREFLYFLNLSLGIYFEAEEIQEVGAASQPVAKKGGKRKIKLIRKR